MCRVIQYLLRLWTPLFHRFLQLAILATQRLRDLRVLLTENAKHVLPRLLPDSLQLAQAPREHAQDAHARLHVGGARALSHDLSHLRVPLREDAVHLGAVRAAQRVERVERRLDVCARAGQRARVRVSGAPQEGEHLVGAAGRVLEQRAPCLLIVLLRGAVCAHDVADAGGFVPNVHYVQAWMSIPQAILTDGSHHPPAKSVIPPPASPANI